ncbi:MAG: DNA cytosine methyltransferase, partial [Rikenellaceae bacterium]
MPVVSKNSRKISKAGELLTYVSLFSSAGVGCYGFKEESFNCVATVELIERRLKVQEHNKKCMYKSGYIGGDITTDEVKNRVFTELEMWKKNLGVSDLDVLIATPPCQGMSVANHKKKDELQRNSLVVESLKLTKRIKPKFFIFENVRAFLTSVCTDIDGVDKPIREAIDSNLSGEYNIHYQVINFKDYGNPSSRTRTLVLGVRKDLKEVTPIDIFPDMQPEVSLRETIGNLPSLKKMGEMWSEDIYHNFRKYAPHMESWIADIKEGQSAFDNNDISKIPHRVKDGVVIYNARKNGDKYTRQIWDKVAPCIHTRNDIMASQSTVHPSDNRVFSVREVMRMMSVPDSFKWS